MVGSGASEGHSVYFGETCSFEAFATGLFCAALRFFGRWVVRAQCFGKLLQAQRKQEVGSPGCCDHTVEKLGVEDVNHFGRLWHCKSKKKSAHQQQQKR